MPIVPTGSLLHITVMMFLSIQHPVALTAMYVCFNMHHMIAYYKCILVQVHVLEIIIILCRS